MERSTKIWIGVGIGVVALGITAYIFRKKIFSAARKTFGGYKWFEEGLEWYRNQTLKDGVESLHPDYRDDVKEFFSWMEKETDWHPVWSSGYRTFEKQAQLYAQNSKNAPAGKSDHNYGFAMDINIRNKKTGVQLFKADSKAKWEASGIPQKAKELGFEWGGDFANYHDPVHFAKAGVPSTTKLLSLHNEGKVDSQGYVKLAA